MSDIVGAAQPQASPLIKEATIETFERDVLEASLTAPVIVDFWAEWCGPCKQLTPALEAAVTRAGGAVSMVKVDIEKNQMLASQLRIQSVPTVYAFFQGRPVDGFQGAIPDSEIDAFVKRVISVGGEQSSGEPSTDEILKAADEAFAAGEIPAAAEAYSHILQAADPKDPDTLNLNAVAGLARCHLKTDAVDQARQIIDIVPDAKRTDPIVSSVIAQLALLNAGSADSEEISTLRAKHAASPSDLQIQFDLAEALTASGSEDEGVDHLLNIFATNRDWGDDAARKKLLTIFEALGPSHDVTMRGRRRLSSLMFS